jgi:cobyrinic acid a,c-diamide synthase
MNEMKGGYMIFTRPRFIISALKGGAGKTILSLGLIAAWREMGHRVAPFKKGPDFIDAGWLTFAAGRLCYNLDPFLMTGVQIRESFMCHSSQADLSLIEGNRGLYDGLDVEGCCSTAELAKLLNTPVIIILDVTMATRTTAAIIKGCQTFDPDLNIAGVILNRVGGARQETLIRETIERYCDTPVLGSVPKLRDAIFPERHMGLVPFQETDQAEKAISWAKTTVIESLDLDKIWKIADKTDGIAGGLKNKEPESPRIVSDDLPRIGFIRDKSFWFYYPENLETLKRLGAVLVEINAIEHRGLPRIDALYIGGGFPETQARALADNQTFRADLREAIKNDMPVYAECGGLMYLGKSLIVDGKTYPMVGSIPVEFILQKRPQGHGYTVLEVEGSNPYYSVGQTLKGHEFHYSKAIPMSGEDLSFAFKVRRGYGVDGSRDGICVKNLLATYSHVHAAGDQRWAEGLFRAAVDFQRKPEKCF